MQGGGVTIIEAEENLYAFKKKLPRWKRRTENENFANFPLPGNCLNQIEDVAGLEEISLHGELKQAISMHLDEPVNSLDEYFPTTESYPSWVRQPFTFRVNTADVNDKYLDEIIKSQQSQLQQEVFSTATLSTFRCHQILSYSLIAKHPL